MKDEELRECVEAIVASWPPFELVFYSAEQLIEALSTYEYLEVMGAVRDLVKVTDAAPSLSLLTDFCNFHQTGKWLLS